MNDSLWLDPTVSLRLCLTLLHSLWVVLLLAAIAWLGDRIWRRSVERRYLVHVTALLAALVALPVTYALVGPDTAAVERVDPGSIPAPAIESAIVEPVITSAVPTTAVAGDRPVTSNATQAETAAPISAPTPGRADWQSAATWIVVLYVVGVFVMLGRLMFALLSAQRQAARASLILSGPVFDTLAGLARDWSMRIVPAVAVVERIVVPQVVGLLRPMILLPASSLSGLTVDELQMILAHELAHVRRHDLWVNLVQRLAETVLFFNPALWYLTRRITSLREFCCDELACRTLSPAGPAPRTRYAAALLRVAELSCPARAAGSELAALAATGRSPSELRRRIAHLFGEPIREPLRLSRGSLVVIIAGVALLLAGPALWSSADSADPQPTTETADADKDNSPTELHIRGTCTTDDRQPVPNAEVRLYHCAIPSFEVTLLQTVHTGNDGRYQFEAMPSPSAVKLRSRAECYPLTVSAPGRCSDISGLPQRLGSTVVMDFSLKPAATLEGRITGRDRKPIVGADVWIQGIGMGPVEGILSTKTDADGRFAIRDAEPWKAEDDVSEPSVLESGFPSLSSLPYRIRHPEYGTRMGRYTETPGTVNDTFFPAAIVEGRVVIAETGEPAAGVLVRALSGIGLYGSYPYGSERVRTSADGRYRMALPASTYNLWVHHDDLTALPIEGLAVKSGENRSAPDLELIQGGLVVGRLVDAVSGEPVAVRDDDRVHLKISGPAQPARSTREQIEHIQPDGTFQFRLPPGRNELALPHSRLGSFTFADKPDEPIAVDIIDGQTLDLPLKVNRVVRQVAGTASAGTTTGETLAVDAVADERSHDSPAFVTVDITGRALDHRGRPIANARIYAASLRVDEYLAAEATTDSDGRYQMQGVNLQIDKADSNIEHDLAYFQVFGIAEGYALAFRPYKVVHPDVKHRKDLRDIYLGDIDPPSRFGTEDPIDIDLTFSAGTSIRGRLVDDHSQPIAGAGIKIRGGEATRKGIKFSIEALNADGIVPESFRERITDADGYFEFTSLTGDVVWSIDIRPDGHSPRRIFAAWIPLADIQGHRVYSGDFEIVFPRPNDVTVQVVYDDTGEPAEKVGVGGLVLEAGFWETTDENGLVHVRLPKGTFQLTASPRYRTPYLNTTTEVVIPDEQSSEPITLRLRPAAVVEVTVTDADTGRPLAGADCWCEEHTSRGEPYRTVRGYRSWEVETRISHYETPRSDEQGQMRVNFEPGRHVIGIAHESYPEGYSVVGDGKTVECEAGKVTTVKFQMRRRAAQTSQAELPSPSSETEVAASSAPRFELLVVDPDGQPAPNASVELRINPHPTQEQILVGKFDKESTYGPLVRTDDAGRLVFTRAKEPRQFNISIKTPGYGPYWAAWSSDEHPQAIPAQFTAELETAWSVGGIVVDEQGAPIAGVQVHPSISYKKRPGDEEHLGVGTRIATDDAGRWRFDSVPNSMSDVFVAINHPDFAPSRRPLVRAEFGLALDQLPTAAITLSKGLTVAGHVADEDGKPVAGALLRTKFLNDIREAYTDANGDYRLMGCEPRTARLVVSAAGRATDMQIVRPDPDLGPVNFTMRPGGHVRIRVVDEQGHGIPRARIFYQRWRGMVDYFEFDHKDQYADENGVWEWNEAPLDEFQADICRPDGMQLKLQKLVPSGEEYVFTPPAALIVSGSVINAVTKEPIKKFRVTPGLRNADPAIRMNWNTSESYEAKDGTYRLRFSHSYPSELVRIEADGYEVAISRDIRPDEGEITVDFELRPAADIVATILAPDGQPAAGAKVALALAGMQVNIRNGEIEDDSTYATRRDAAADGSFRFSARNEPFHLVITHPSGYAWFKSEQEIPTTIDLTPWARIEGVFRAGAQPAENVTLTYGSDLIHSYGDDVPSIFTRHKTTTGPGGRYVFERVVPGEGRIGREIVLMVKDGATEVTSSKRVRVNVPAGQTTTVDLGGDGRAVIARLLPKADAKLPVLWNIAMVSLYAGGPLPERPTPPDDVQKDEVRLKKWWEDWTNSPAGKEWRQAYEARWERRSAAPQISATVDREGSFRIDDVPPGEYVLDVRFNLGEPGLDRSAGTLLEVPITVPSADDLVTAAPLDLGVLQLQ